MDDVINREGTNTSTSTYIHWHKKNCVHCLNMCVCVCMQLYFYYLPSSHKNSKQFGPSVSIKYLAMCCAPSAPPVGTPSNAIKCVYICIDSNRIVFSNNSRRAACKRTPSLSFCVSLLSPLCSRDQPKRTPTGKEQGPRTKD